MPILLNMSRSNMKIFLFSVVVMLVATVSISCGNNGSDNQQQVDEKSIYENPIDSIVQYIENIRTGDERRLFVTNLERVYDYLVKHPNFINNSDSIGYISYKFDNIRCALWRDCGDIRVYTIPYSTNRGVIYRNIVQFKDDGRADTSFLYEEDNLGGMYDIIQLKDKNGKTHYLLFTQYLYDYCGRYYEEGVRAFSIEKECLMRDGLFHKNKKAYDELGASCGTPATEIPLDFEYVRLIYYNDSEYTDNIPTLIISETDGCWPTCNGFKYLWNGECFEYVDKCTYAANGDYEPGRQ